MINSMDLKENIASKKSNFVTFEMKYTGSEEDNDLEIFPMLIFSPEERAATNLGARQGDHSTALALSMERIINAINYGFPTEDEKFKGISELTAVLYSVVKQDKFFLKKFFPDSQDNMFILGQYGKRSIFTVSIDEFISEIDAELKKANARIDILKQASFGCAEENVILLLKLAREIKLEYCASLATKAARHIIEYQNKSPWAAFEKIELTNNAERNFNKAESSRVVNALEALRVFGSSQKPLSEKEQDEIASQIANLLYYPRVSDEYHKNAMSEYQLVLDRHDGKKTGQRGPIPKLNKRTNNETIFCYVVARHLATTFATFMELNLSPHKNDIIDKTIDLIMTTNNGGATLKWYNKPNEKIKKTIKSAFTEWEQENLEQVEDLNVSASSVNTVEFGDLGEDVSSDSKKPKIDYDDMLEILKKQIELLSIVGQQDLQIWLNNKLTSSASSNSSRATLSRSSMTENVANNSKASTHQYSFTNINYGPSAFLWASQKMVGAIGSSGKILNRLAKDGVEKGLSQLVNASIREGFVNGLKQVVIPRCSLHMTMRFR